MGNNETKQAINPNANQSMGKVKQDQQQKKGFQQGNGNNDDDSKLNQTQHLKAENETGMENYEPLTYGYQRIKNNANGNNAINQKQGNGERKENGNSYEDEEGDVDNAEGLYSNRDYAEQDSN